MIASMSFRPFLLLAVLVCLSACGEAHEGTQRDEPNLSNACECFPKAHLTTSVEARELVSRYSRGIPVDKRQDVVRSFQALKDRSQADGVIHWIEGALSSAPSGSLPALLAPQLDRILFLAAQNPDVLVACCRVLHRALKSDSLHIRVIAADNLMHLFVSSGLGEDRVANYWPTIAEGLSDASREIRARAREAVWGGYRPSGEVLSALLAQAGNGEYGDEQLEIGRALGGVVPQRPLVSRVIEKNLHAGQLVLGFLRGTTRFQALDLQHSSTRFICGLATDERPKVRREVLRILSHMRASPDVEEAVQILTLDDNPEIRHAAEEVKSNRSISTPHRQPWEGIPK